MVFIVYYYTYKNIYIYIYTSVDLCISMHRVSWNTSSGDLEVVTYLWRFRHMRFVSYLGHRLKRLGLHGWQAKVCPSGRLAGVGGSLAGPLGRLAGSNL